MREYERLRGRLQRELGASPTQATERLVRQVHEGRVPPLTGIQIETVLPVEESATKMPLLRYARTKDGFDIAYWTLGEGPALIDMGTLPHAHLRHEWQIERWRDWYMHLARRHQVVRYDSRGIGLSATPNVPEFSTDALVTDLEAVVDALALDEVALFAQFHQGLAAIAYAARHPERVSHLILWCCFADGQEFASQTNVQAMDEVLKGNYALYTEICASTHLDWSDDKQLIAQFGTVVAESARQEVVIAFIEAVGHSNVVDLLPLVQAKTLVLHRSENPWLSADAPKTFSMIREADRRTLNCSEGTLALGSDPQSALELIAAFLDEPVARISPASPLGKPR
jgi:pimeloyl-ACP methyl ester carboxylesterase